MRMYLLCKKQILNGIYEKEDMEKKIDIYFLKNKITQDEYTELIELLNKE